MRTPIVSQAEQIIRLKTSLRTYKSRCRALERKVARLEQASPTHQVCEREISLLLERIEEVQARWEEAEQECLQLKKQLQQRTVA